MFLFYIADSHEIDEEILRKIYKDRYDTLFNTRPSNVIVNEGNELQDPGYLKYCIKL